MRRQSRNAVDRQRSMPACPDGSRSTMDLQNDVAEQRSGRELAQLIGRLAKAAEADVVLCGTEHDDLPEYLDSELGDSRLLPATANTETAEKLVAKGFDVVELALRAADKYRQGRHMISTALRAGKIVPGEVVVCAVKHALGSADGDLVLVTDVEADAAEVALHEMIELADGVRPRVLQAALEVASRIGLVTGRGRELGALLVLGDSDRVLEGSNRLIPNPFHGYADEERMLTEPRIQDTLVELAKVDGAFVVRGDGLIRAAGVFLAVSECAVEIPEGLGARHVTAAAISKRTDAMVVAVSATDGNVRVFADGRMVLQVDPRVSAVP